MLGSAVAEQPYSYLDQLGYSFVLFKRVFIWLPTGLLYLFLRLLQSSSVIIAPGPDEINDAKKIDAEVKKIVDKGYERAKKVLNDKIEDLHKLAKALLIYETLSGDEIRDLILRDIKPTRSFKEDDQNDGSTSSALGSLGLKPKPAI